MSVYFKQLSETLEGELLWDHLHRAIYATDASVYRMKPLAVAYPCHVKDIQKLVAFAQENKITLIPRAAGTSLAGQCVGEGIIVDISKYFTKILNLDVAKRQVRVEPGVIRDELNRFLKPHGLFFGPNTSTSNRCTIGGMVGNNSSGTTSIKYGVTRDKVIALACVLSDQSSVVFKEMDDLSFREKIEQSDLEGTIYKTLYNALQPEKVQKRIKAEFPKPEIHRRNTGYAVDMLLQQYPFSPKGSPCNLASLLTGSEGTLAFTTAITLQLDPLPPSYNILIAAHFDSIDACMEAVVPAMTQDLYTCEMMDKVILDCTKNNRTQLQNRFFIEGDPIAILMLEVRGERESETLELANEVIDILKTETKAYAYPILQGKEIDQAMELRKAGLGLLGNMIGDKKAVACIEDTAVAITDLKQYILEFSRLMDVFDQEAVYYAHAGAGELHLRPILNLKKSGDVKHFKEITQAVARLVKKYKGSMSGEHGDGIARSTFLKDMIGEENYKVLRHIKQTFDPDNVFNQGKIIDAYPMDENLRYIPDRKEPSISTFLNFDDQQGILRLAEQCNGSGDCRKLPTSGGTMCPSYHATRNEKDTTRARANALRSFLTEDASANKFNHKELKDVFALCLSCKACASECPSNVDVASLKAEFEYQYQKTNGTSFRTRLLGHSTRLNSFAAKAPVLSNFVFKSKPLAYAIKAVTGIAQKRSLPIIRPFKERRNGSEYKHQNGRKVYLYIDEFTQYLDGNIGEDAYQLLKGLGYEVTIISNLESGRAYISKGLLKQAKRCVQKAINQLKDKVNDDIPLIGIEPSAILTFRDELKRFVNDSVLVENIVKNSFLIEEFLHTEIEKGHITAAHFTKETKRLKVHNHCHQKALSGQHHTFALLNLPVNYKPTLVASGCCGMAGSFGYEKDHYEISMNIGEQALFPAIRNADEDVIIVANGTSCRHQIKDGTQRLAQHPVTVLRQALLNLK